MVSRPFAILTVMALCLGAGRAQDKVQQPQKKAAEVDETVKVEIALAKEHVPKKLKAGNKVDLKYVASSTVAPSGLTSYRTVVIAEGMEVVSITPVEKPADPDQAVKVELKGTKKQAEKVAATKSQMVTVTGRQPDGTFGSRKKPVTLRLEYPKADQ